MCSNRWIKIHQIPFNIYFDCLFFFANAQDASHSVVVWMHNCMSCSRRRCDTVTVVTRAFVHCVRKSHSVGSCACENPLFSWSENKIKFVTVELMSTNNGEFYVMIFGCSRNLVSGANRKECRMKMSVGSYVEFCFPQLLWKQHKYIRSISTAQLQMLQAATRSYPAYCSAKNGKISMRWYHKNSFRCTRRW